MSNPVYLALDLPQLDAAKALADRVKAHVDGFKLGLEFFCAHGHDSLLGLVDVQGQLLVELEHCRLFRGAVLVCCSCLANEQFPVRLAQLNGSVAAVIGYTPALSVADVAAVANCAVCPSFPSSATLSCFATASAISDCTTKMSFSSRS